MKNVHSIKLYSGAVFSTIVSPLTLDDVDVYVKKHCAKDHEVESYKNRTDKATIYVTVALKPEDLMSLATQIGCVMHENNKGGYGYSHDSMGGLAKAWDLEPNMFTADYEIKTNYNRKRTAETKERALKDANVLLDNVDVEILKADALARLNASLVRVVADYNHQCKCSVQRMVEQCGVNAEWLADELVSNPEIDAQLHATLRSEVAELDERRRVMVGNISKIRKVILAMERKTITDSLLEDAAGCPELAEMINGITPEDAPDMTWGFELD